MPEKDAYIYMCDPNQAAAYKGFTSSFSDMIFCISLHTPHLVFLGHDLLQPPESLGADTFLLPLLDHQHHVLVGGLELLQEDVGVHAPLRLQQVHLRGGGSESFIYFVIY